MGILLIGKVILAISVTIGGVFNTALLLLIVYRTPQQMLVYSRILMQTSIIDILLLLDYAFFVSATFKTAKGNGIYIYGLIKWIAPKAPSVVLFIFLMFQIYLVFISLFGFVAQFIYRYLTLIRLDGLQAFSTKRYFLMFLAISIVPLTIVLGIGYCYYPHPGLDTIEDESVAMLLGINSTSEKTLILAGFMPIEKAKMGLITECYLDITSTVAYIVLLVLGWKTQRFISNNTKVTNKKGSQKNVELNKQLNRTLIIQAMLPFTIYFASLLLTLTIIYGASLSSEFRGYIQYYSMLLTIPMLAPSVFNPIVAIAVIKPFRKSFITSVKGIWEKFPLNKL